MPFNEDIAARLKSATTGIPDMVEKRMFGGVCFMYRNKMAVGVVKNDLMVRVICEKMDEQLEKEFVRPMDFTKKPMKEFIYVSAEGFESEFDLQRWIELGIEHATTAAL
jgi:TfoX/Sxy family transcriptional regulator of competence genes